MNIGEFMKVKPDWSNGFECGSHIKMSLLNFCLSIGKDNLQDIVVWINCETSMTMSKSPEIRDYFRQSPFAFSEVCGDSPSHNGVWGLPDHLYGIRFHVEGRDSNIPNGVAIIKDLSGKELAVITGVV